MANGKNLTNWSTITTEDQLKLSNAEFRGMVLQALTDIRDDIADIKQQNNITRYISFAISGATGVISGVFGKNISG